MRNTNCKTLLSKQLKFFKEKLIERGYDSTEIQNIIDDVMQYDRDETLRSKEKSSSKSPNVIVTKFDPRIRCLKKRLLKHWHLIKSNESLNTIFSNEPMIAYSRHKNINEMLSTSKL